MRVLKYDSQFHKFEQLSKDIVWQDPKEMLTEDRLDLCIKIDYVNCIVNNIDSDFILNKYKNDIAILTNGTFVESGETDKNSFDDYNSVLKKLIQKFRSDGFDSNESVIPVSKDNVILDGGHRFAICYVLGIKIPTIKLNTNSLTYDIQFYKSRIIKNEVIEYYLMSYLKKTNKNIKLMIEWPNKHNLKKCLMNKIGNKVIYEKEIKVNYNSIKNLMLMNYWGESWLGGIAYNNYGIHNKARACFNGDFIRVYWVNEESEGEVELFKNDIRCEFGNTKHILHSTESQAETIMLSKSLLNKNSLKMLYYIEPEKNSEYLKRLIDTNFEFDESIAVCGSACLGLLGIRKPEDIDVISYVPNVENNHNDIINKYNMTKNEDIIDESNIFYYFGVKFIFIDNVISMKESRNELKDKIDVQKIRKVYKSDKELFSDLTTYMFVVLNKIILLLIRLIKFLGLKKPVIYLLKRFNGGS